MRRRFVIEAVMAAIYGEIMVPNRPVEYVLPYSTIQELYDMKENSEPVMPDPADDAHVKAKIKEMISFFEDSFNRKKIEKIFPAPWRLSAPLIVNENVSFVVVNSMENAQYGETFDPIETELLLTSLREQVPMLTDQLDFLERVIETEVPVQVFDIEDFEYALEVEPHVEETT
ncbi:ADP-heptose synthase [Paenibacillus sp. TRM 82003]|nr:ADP-heptose synthase [Paenibacillus sp. TRM 82003]